MVVLEHRTQDEWKLNMADDITNAIDLVWDVAQACDVDMSHAIIDVYDRRSGSDGSYSFGDLVSETDARNLAVDLEDLQAIVSLDSDHDYYFMSENTTADVDLGPCIVTPAYCDPDTALASVRAILDRDDMYDSGNVDVHVYNEETGDDIEFRYGEDISEDDVERLYDLDEIDDVDDVVDSLQKVVNLESYELPGDMSVMVDLGRLTLM